MHLRKSIETFAWRRYITVAVFCAVISAGVALGFSSLKEKQYTATASLLFRDPQLDQKLFGSSFFAPSGDAVREAATNLELASAPIVAVDTARALGGGTTKQDVQDAIAVKPDGPSDLVSVEATLPSPATAQRFANTYATAFLAYRRRSDQSKVDAARRLVQDQLERLSPAARSSGRGVALQTRAQQLEVLASLQTGNVEVAQAAELPTDPSSPKTRQNTLLGAFVGAILGLAAGWFSLRNDGRLRSIDEVEALGAGPLLGTLPPYSSSAGAATAQELREPARLLNSRLRYFNVDRELRTVLVTSAAVSEGKSTVSMQLAIAAAEQGQRVLLIEADLRRPSLRTKFGTEPQAGLVDAVVSGGPWRDKVAHTKRADGALDVLFAGQTPPNPGDILASKTFEALLKDAATTYDLVVLDTPPLLVVADAFPLVPAADGIIVVVRMGNSDHADVERLVADIRRIDGDILGVVANDHRIASSQYYYA